MNNIHHHYNHPSSFSSSLLEEIYRSFDKDKDEDHIHSDNSSYKRMKMKMNKSTSYRSYDNSERYQVKKYVLDQWMEENDTLNVNKRRNSMPDSGKYRRPLNYSSSTSSSDSNSSGIGGFSSSDTETSRGKNNLKIPTLKPIRTGVTSPESHRKSYSDEVPVVSKKKSKKEGKLQLQQRALKLYGDLKKVKQPISPGGKLATFLNSLFHSGNSSSRKPKLDPSPASAPSSLFSRPKACDSSTPSTTYSRSCLSKTPSSAGRFERRSVRFYPVSVIVGEDARPCGQKPVSNDGVSRVEEVLGSSDRDREELRVQIMEKQRRVEEVAKELLKNYHKKYGREDIKVNIVSDHGISRSNKFDNDVNMRGFEDEDEDEDDDESCCSSDLFELDNLMEIGVGDRYREELPVYETTHLGTNRAIANGFIL